MGQVTCSQCGNQNPAGFKFCGHCGAAMMAAAPVEAAAPAAEPAGAPMAAQTDERRQVTVLFADVSGFTQMSSRMDPEDVHAVMNRVFGGLGQAVRDEGGHIDKYIGDNIMALFGAPVAHEDDPVRACRAALKMQAFLTAFSAGLERQIGVSLAMRIGINDGLVVAGAVGSQLKSQYSVMGDSVNIASRLESAAEPGTILVSAPVFRRAHQHFDFGPPRLLCVKGKDEQIAACVLLKERAAIQPEELTRLAGRDDELAELIDRLGSGFVEVRGERGVGKARLVHEATRREGRPLVMIGPASTAIAERPLGLIRRVVQALVLHMGGRIVASREDLLSFLASVDPDVAAYGDALWYLAAPPTAEAAAADPDPLTFRRTIEHGFASLLRAVARAEPSLVLFIREWAPADSGSIQWLENIAGADTPGMPALIVSCSLMHQPPLNPAHVQWLRPLTVPLAEQLLDELVVGAQVPHPVRQDILRRAAGLPLLIEQLTEALRDQGMLRPDQVGWTWSGDHASLELPASLRSAMLSRVDHLPAEDRLLLFQCAVQGVDFDLDVCELVRQAPRWGGPRVQPLMRSLEQHHLVTAPANEANRRSFRLELMQQVCYETLLKRDRRELHALTADALRQLAPDPRRLSADLMAYHEERAERWAAAAGAMLQAAQHAADVYVNDQALERFDRAIQMAVKAESDAQPAMRGIVALAHRGTAATHLLLGNYALAAEHAALMSQFAVYPSQAAEAARLTALVCARTGKAGEAIEVLERIVADTSVEACCEFDVLSRAWGELAQLHHRAGRLDEALRCVERCRASICTSPQLREIEADLLEGAIQHTRGDFRAAWRLYQRAHDAAQPLGSLSHLARAANCLGNVARDRGDYEGARASYRRAMDVWSRMSDTECIAGACTNLGNVAMSIGNFDEAERHHRNALATWASIMHVRGVGLAQANLAILSLERGDGAAAIQAADAALEQALGAGDQVLTSLVQVVRAEGLITSDRLDEADNHIRQMLEDPSISNQPLARAGLDRAMAKAAHRRGDLEQARRRFEAAVDAFIGLKRIQEAARTRLLLAVVMHEMNDAAGARAQVNTAVRELESSTAMHDLKRAHELLTRLDAAHQPPIRNRS